MTARIFRNLDAARGQFGPCALAIGNFDGVHIGHRALLNAVLEHSEQRKLIPAVLTFHPHPTAVVAPERQPEMICTLEDRLRLLIEAGARHVFVLEFTAEIARMSPSEFVTQILVAGLGTKATFVGENFHFGHRQAGKPETLRRLGSELGFESYFLKPVMYRGEVVSSSLIRQYISAGRVARAGRLLGRCLSLSGTVVGGNGIGSKQTVPTLNLRPVPGLALPRGVFVTETHETSGARRWPSVTNVGVRPTFGGSELTVETFLLSPLAGASPEEIEIRFRWRLRGERQFPTPEALKAQILRDAARAQAYWHRAGKLA